MAVSSGKISTYSSKASSALSSTQSVIGQLFLSKLKSNPNYTTTFTLPGSMGIVTGFCEGGIAFQGTADWKPICDLGSIEDTAAAVQAAWAAFASQSNPDKSYSQTSFKQVRGTEMRYSGSNCPAFQLKLILPSYDSSAKQTPMEAVRLLMRSVYPEYGDVNMLGTQLQAPLGYGIRFSGQNQQADTPFNTVAVRKGKYFYMPHALIKSVSSTFSGEVMTDGMPLYTEVNIEFIPWRTPSYSEAMKWFYPFT
jgi:hypothetical protein